MRTQSSHLRSTGTALIDGTVALGIADGELARKRRAQVALHLSCLPLRKYFSHPSSVGVSVTRLQSPG
jgi:hypothetical protein